ncbi:sesquipedalian-1 isoform X1 [Ranitomeya imitator]|uniref:sesquipedalian-1 isoform X1 n=2 Tax=Ranitomeya imitator TaxID=111125 RepID=UPI0037E8DF9F
MNTQGHTMTGLDIREDMKLNERNLVYYATCNSPIDKSGFLYKKGDRNTSYHRRWFVLKGNMLFYYEHQESKEPVGAIILEGCRVELCESSEEYAFAIRFGYSKSRAYILAADSHATMESWVKALSRANFEYIRLVVKELQQQLMEMRKGQPSSSGTTTSTDTSPSAPLPACPSAPLPALPCIQDRPVIKDNGCAPWSTSLAELPNGFTYNNGPHYKDATWLMEGDSVNQGHHQSSDQSQRVGENEHYGFNEIAEDRYSFTKLHDFFGEEIKQLRAQWTKSFHEDSTRVEDSE